MGRRIAAPIGALLLTTVCSNGTPVNVHSGEQHDAGPKADTVVPTPADAGDKGSTEDAGSEPSNTPSMSDGGATGPDVGPANQNGGASGQGGAAGVPHPDASTVGGGSSVDGGLGGSDGGVLCTEHALGVPGCSCGAEWIQVVDDGEEDRIAALVVGPEARLSATGFSRTNMVDTLWVRSYGADGTELWSRTAPGLPQDIAGDAFGNVIVSGYTADAQHWMRKYDPSGDTSWTVEGGEPRAGIATDPAGNIVVTGPNLGATKYDPLGAELWSTSGELPYSRAVAADAEGNIVVAGDLRREDGAVDGFNPHTDIAIRKLDSEGDELWMRTYDGGRDDVAHAIAVDSENNVIVAGLARLATENSGVLEQGWLRKYSADGEVLWTRVEATAGSRSAHIAVGLDGSVFVVWLRLFEYAADGMKLDTSSSCSTEQIAIDSSGRLFFSGSVNLPNQGAFVELADAWLGAYSF